MRCVNVRNESNGKLVGNMSFVKENLEISRIAITRIQSDDFLTDTRNFSTPCINLFIFHTCVDDFFGLKYLSRCTDTLPDGRSGDRILVGARFSAAARIGPGSQPVFYSMDNQSFPAVKRPRRSVEYPRSSSAGLKNE